MLVQRGPIPAGRQARHLARRNSRQVASGCAACRTRRLAARLGYQDESKDQAIEVLDGQFCVTGDFSATEPLVTKVFEHFLENLGPFTKRADRLAGLVAAFGGLDVKASMFPVCEHPSGMEPIDQGQNGDLPFSLGSYERR